MRGRSLLRWLVAMLAATGCKAAADNRPIIGGGGGGMNGGPDGPLGLDSGASGILTGTVCITTDLRTPFACATHAAAGIVVTDRISGTSTTTAADGTFSLGVGAATTVLLDLGVGDATSVPTTVPIGVTATPIDLPLTSKTYLTDLETNLDAVVPDGSGIIALYVIDATGKGLPGYAVTAPPGTVGGTFYDDELSTDGWSANGVTGAIGGTLMFGVPPVASDLTVTKAGVDSVVTAVPVVDGHVTFVTDTITP